MQHKLILGSREKNRRVTLFFQIMSIARVSQQELLVQDLKEKVTLSKKNIICSHRQISRMEMRHTPLPIEATSTR